MRFSRSAAPYLIAAASVIIVLTVAAAIVFSHEDSGAAVAAAAVAAAAAAAAKLGKSNDETRSNMADVVEDSRRAEEGAKLARAGVDAQSSVTKSEVGDTSLEDLVGEENKRT